MASGFIVPFPMRGGESKEIVQKNWAYHGDDGEKYVEAGTGLAYGETFGAGDVVGVKGKLIPAVGMRSVGAKAKINFGPGGFRYKRSKDGKDEKS